MPRKKAEPEVLQEETVQPEITDIEELTPAERPGLAPQIEEPVQPYGEEESSAAEELPEPSEPEKKSFYDLDFRALDQDLSQPKRHARHDHRRRSAFHDHPQRTDRRGRNKADVLRSHCAVPRPHFDPGNGNVG